MRPTFHLLFALLALTSITLFAPQAHALGRSESQEPALPTVERLEIDRYLGLWYEIVRLPQSFEKGCAGVTARYSLREDGKIDVLNRCLKDSLEGEEKLAKGVARVVDPVTQAKLKVSFFWPFSGDYWVLELGENYEYSVVGAPDRQSLWILSRTPQMDEAVIQGILERRAAQGFDITQIERTLQPSNP